MAEIGIRRVVVASCKKNDFMKEYIYNIGLPVQITETLYEIKYAQSKLVYYFNGFRNHFQKLSLRSYLQFVH